MLLLRGRRAGFNVNGLMLVCGKHSGEQKGQNTSVKESAECVSRGFWAGLAWLALGTSMSWYVPGSFLVLLL